MHVSYSIYIHTHTHRDRKKVKHIHTHSNTTKTSKILLLIMGETQLNLPAPHYGIHSIIADELKAYVEIHGVPNFPQTLRFIGITSTAANLSQQTAARQAISFLQDTYNLNIGDYNYYQMKLLEDSHGKIDLQVNGNAPNV